MPAPPRRLTDRAKALTERAMGAILTVQEVAERMRCEHRTVRRAIRSGELEAALIGGRWLVREEAVDEWFRSRCAAPNPFIEPGAAPDAACRPRNGRWRGERRATAGDGGERRMSVRKRGKQLRGEMDGGRPQAAPAASCAPRMPAPSTSRSNGANSLVLSPPASSSHARLSPSSSKRSGGRATRSRTSRLIRADAISRCGARTCCRASAITSCARSPRWSSRTSASR